MEKELERLAEDYFIHRVLNSYGFESAQLEVLMAYDRTAGQLVHKYGALYQTEIMMNPPMRSSFYYPSRILIASRCEKEAFAISLAKMFCLSGEVLWRKRSLAQCQAAPGCCACRAARS